MTTIYECCKRSCDVNRTPVIQHFADTEKEAINWLKKNGGGVYRNTLHNFSMTIKGGER